jgi:hypothetical protein
VSTFEVGGNEYRIDKLDPFKQLHVMRRVSPLIPQLIPLFMQVSKKGLSASMDELPELLQPFADALAGMKDEDAEHVIGTCMSAVKRRQGDSWSPVWNASAKMSQFKDLNDLSVLIPMVVRVITENLGPFINGLLTGEQTGAAPTKA